jgi:hypothetical protein
VLGVLQLGALVVARAVGVDDQRAQGLVVTRGLGANIDQTWLV